MHRRLFTLDEAEEWALGTDNIQWMILKKRKVRNGNPWRPVCFISSFKRVLMLSLRERGVKITPEAKYILGRFAETFKEWRGDKDWIGDREADEAADEALIKEIDQKTDLFFRKYLSCWRPGQRAPS